jgi:hypothetical protein
VRDGVDVQAEVSWAFSIYSSTSIKGGKWLS